MKNKKYLVLYYFSFVITILFMGYASYKYLKIISIGDIGFSEIISHIFDGVIGIINIIMVVIFTILVLKRKKIKVDNNLFPIAYICFFTIVVALCFIFNNKVMVPYMHFNYYLFFINIGYLLLNIYSLLLVNKK